MRKIREVLRVVWLCGLTRRQAASSCGLGRTTVRDYLRRAQESGLSWSAIESLSDVELERRLYPPAVAVALCDRAVPEWAELHKELRRKGVTLQLLWEEYRSSSGTASSYSYSRFCELYSRWRQHLDVTMRQTHTAGEQVFVDYAGQTVPVVDRSSGEEREAQIFVAVWGASNYTYAEATWSQRLEDWIGSHESAFESFGGVPEVLVPDNLRSGVSRACRYEPELNPTYREMAEHYGVAVVPARVRKPRDKDQPAYCTSFLMCGASFG